MKAKITMAAAKWRKGPPGHPGGFSFVARPKGARPFTHPVAGVYS